MSSFSPPQKGREQEEGSVFSPKFGEDGLITAVACDHESGEILMLAHMNPEALEKTITSGKAHYWSRSRKSIWLKGETSGNTQTVMEMRTDCDQDAIVMKVRVDGADASCHTGRVSCFYRIVVAGQNGPHRLVFEDRERVFDPETVYNK